MRVPRPAWAETYTEKARYQIIQSDNNINLKYCMHKTIMYWWYDFWKGHGSQMRLLRRLTSYSSVKISFTQVKIIQCKFIVEAPSSFLF